MTRQSGDSRIPVAVVGPGSLQGEIAALEGGRRLATVAATRRRRCCASRSTPLRELLATGPDVALSVIRTAVARLRAMEATLREREKLAALGTLSAGLAHELNNPAAAALRRSGARRGGGQAERSRPRRRHDRRRNPLQGRRSNGRIASTRSADRRAPRRRRSSRPAGRGAPASSRRGRSVAGRGRGGPSAAGGAGAGGGADQRDRRRGEGLRLPRPGAGRARRRPHGLEQTLVILRHRLRTSRSGTVAADLPKIEAMGPS